MSYFDHHATPLFTLRDRLHRCESGPWTCWRRAVVDFPILACERHEDNQLRRLALAMRQQYRTDPGFRRAVDEAAL